MHVRTYVCTYVRIRGGNPQSETGVKNKAVFWEKNFQKRKSTLGLILHFSLSSWMALKEYFAACNLGVLLNFFPMMDDNVDHDKTGPPKFLMQFGDQLIEF